MGVAHVLDLSAVVSREAARLEEDVRVALEAFPSRERRVDAALVLSPRELMVLRLVGLGLTNEEIAAAARTSRHTTRHQVKQIHDKCGVDGRGRLAVVAHVIAERGLWREDRETASERRESKAARREMLAEMVA